MRGVRDVRLVQILKSPIFLARDLGMLIDLIGVLRNDIGLGLFVSDEDTGTEIDQHCSDFPIKDLNGINQLMLQK